LALALGIGAFAQGRGGPAPSPTPTPPSPTSPTPTNPNNPNGNFPNTFPGSQPNTQPDMMQRPMFLSGKVVLDDGTPPPDPVTIQIVCRGVPRAIAYTDGKGNFNVDLANRNLAVFADASEPNSDLGLTPNNSGFNSRGVCPGETSFLGTEIQAYLAGYRSDTVNLGMRRSLDNPDIGTLVLHRLANVEGLTISATSALAPKEAKKALEKARDEQRKKKWPEAEKELQKAVAIYPKYASAWLELGNLQLRQKNTEAARNSYTQALAADPKFVGPYLQLATIAAGEQKWQDVADDTDRLLRLNPVDFPQAWMFNAIANYNLRKLDLAEKSAREGLSRDPNHRFPGMSHLLGVLLAMKQDYAASAQNLRDYVRYAPHATDLEQVKKELVEIEKVAAAAEPKAQ
jgi:tetratricopeptide (TPR) repeat protein